MYCVLDVRAGLESQASGNTNLLELKFITVERFWPIDRRSSVRSESKNSELRDSGAWEVGCDDDNED